jgi:1-phosphofructokinase family hexose kinase
VKQPVIVALNPSIDAEWRVDGLRREEKNNVLDERRWAGGKGVNVARWLQQQGARPLLILPLGGLSGRELASDLRRWKIATHAVRIREATRVNVIVTAPAQGQMRFNPLGPKLSRLEWSEIRAAVQAALKTASCVILSGSLPRGLPVDSYARLIRLARTRGVPVLLDCDGPVLAAAVPEGPFLVKPNEHELAGWIAATHRNAGLQPGASAMSKVTGGWVLVSRGAKPALLVNVSEGFSLFLKPVRVKPRNTVGAGDALLAAVALSIRRGESPAQWLRAGLQAGAIAVRSHAGQWLH